MPNKLLVLKHRINAALHACESFQTCKENPIKVLIAEVRKDVFVVLGRARITTIKEGQEVVETVGLDYFFKNFISHGSLSDLIQQFENYAKNKPYYLSPFSPEICFSTCVDETLVSNQRAHSPVFFSLATHLSVDSNKVEKAFNEKEFTPDFSSVHMVSFLMHHVFSACGLPKEGGKIIQYPVLSREVICLGIELCGSNRGSRHLAEEITMKVLRNAGFICVPGGATSSNLYNIVDLNLEPNTERRVLFRVAADRSHDGPYRLSQYLLTLNRKHLDDRMSHEEINANVLNSMKNGLLLASDEIQHLPRRISKPT